MQFVVVTGMSGAGKSTVLKFFEDIGFFCVDNLPPALIPKFVDICYRPGTDIERVALGIDIRGGKLFSEMFEVLSSISKVDYNYSILFLDAKDEVLLKRFKESRRMHPLAKGGLASVGIEKERELLLEVKEKADYIIDTSNVLTRHLKEQINKIFLQNEKFESLMITILSFGFKYGAPPESDLVFDVRFIPNPFYIAEMKELTGNNVLVRDYVLSWEESNIFLEKLLDMTKFLIPNYIKEGKNQLVISIGCTGGKHRSVTLANEFYLALQKEGHSVIINHRDIDKDYHL